MLSNFIPEISKVKEYINIILSNGVNVKDYSKLINGIPVEADIDKIILSILLRNGSDLIILLNFSL